MTEYFYNPNKTVLIDFDGTLQDFGWPNPPGDPFPGAVKALQALKSAGYHIIIFTARAWSGWDQMNRKGKSKVEQVTEAANWLTSHKIPFDAITAEKQPCLFIVDDSALTGGPNFDWGRFAERVLRGEGHTSAAKKAASTGDQGAE
jgi:ribonucleotide monophosphatase NagD (HAD superfamily)